MSSDDTLYGSQGYDCYSVVKTCDQLLPASMVRLYHRSVLKVEECTVLFMLVSRHAEFDFDQIFKFSRAVLGAHVFVRFRLNTELA